jgi:ribosomal protein S18 acetylase RimI-like enzyme
MWVAPTARGLGVGRRLLAELESRAAERGSHAIRLETNRALTEAIAMYRSAGYREVAAFNDEPYADHWFEKRLGDTVQLP